MKATIIKILTPPSGDTDEVPGWIAPGTNDTLAVDIRFEADLSAIPPQHAKWYITHLPTGYRVGHGDYTRAGYRDDAVNIAKRFYEAATEIGCDLTSAESSDVVGPIGKLDKDARTKFWCRVAGWPDLSAPPSGRDAE